MYDYIYSYEYHIISIIINFKFLINYICDFFFIIFEMKIILKN